MVIKLPPTKLGAAQVTVVWVVTPTALAAALVGAPGTVSDDAAVTASDTLDAALLPMALAATTVNV